uniref:Uncharacterized protein n=1 Tax=Anguilla anguilla TaxID=7936 RepID=A0A0E9QEW2_ANGAN
MNDALQVLGKCVCITKCKVQRKFSLNQGVGAYC